MLASVRQCSTTAALVVYGGYYLSFRLPVEAETMRGLVRTEVRTVRSHPGVPVSVPFRMYRHARRVALAAILSHRAAMRIPARIAARRTPVQLKLI